MKRKVLNSDVFKGLKVCFWGQNEVFKDSPWMRNQGLALAHVLHVEWITHSSTHGPDADHFVGRGFYVNREMR